MPIVPEPESPGLDLSGAHRPGSALSGAGLPDAPAPGLRSPETGSSDPGTSALGFENASVSRSGRSATTAPERDVLRRRAVALRVLIGGLLLLVVIAGIVSVREWPDAISRLIDQATTLERALGVAGWVLAALVQVVIALCGILPASVGALAAGLLYGVVGGFCVSAFGTLIGAALAFALTRTLFRPVIARMLARRPRFRRLDEAVSRDGWRLVCLLRISPVMPFAVTSYALGLSALDFRSYAIGTLASLPALLGYVVLGHLSGNGLTALAAHQTGWLHWSLLAVAIGATGLLTFKLGSLLRQALRLPEAQ